MHMRNTMIHLKKISWILSIEGDGGGDSGGAGGGGVGAGDGGAPAPFYESFTRQDLKTSPSVQGFKTVEDLAHGYVNLEKRMGIEPERRLDLPKDPADVEGWKAVWKRLGAVEKPEDFGLKLADDANDADKAMLADFSAEAIKLNMPKDMAAGALKWWTTKVAEAQAAQQQGFEAQRTEGEAQLKKDWGQAFDSRTKEIGRLLAEHGDEALTKDLGGNLGNYPGLARFLGKMLDKMAEPGTAGGGGGDGGAGERALTPAQAAAEARKLESHPGFRDASHPEHKAVVASRQKFLIMGA